MKVEVSNFDNNMIDGIYLLLGTNLGDKESNLLRAIEAIKTNVGVVKKTSSIYKTAAWGKTEQPQFLNQVLLVSTTLQPHELLKQINQIEKALGRIRNEQWGERVIDIDILYYDGAILTDDDLQIPHPGIPGRRFTLVPLVELAPDFSHPVLNKTNFELLKVCQDPLGVVAL